MIAALLLSSCGGGTQRTGSASETLSPRTASPAASKQAPAPETPGALSLVPQTSSSETRLGYADRDRLQAADGLPLGAAAITSAVLGGGAGDASIVIGDRREAFTPADPVETSAITPSAQSAAQSCLGDAIAQTMLGPEGLGDDSAFGAGLAVSEVDAPKGVQLRLCAAPHYRGQVHGSEKAFHEAFDDVKGAIVGEFEVGEREISFATVPAKAVPAARLRSMLAGGKALAAFTDWE